jgi:multidrug efflux pump subunit AcrA (membrane-fusion protein)
MLKAGMFARVVLTTIAESEVPALPVSALREDAGQTYVWVLADGKLARRMVATGMRDGRAQLVEIRSGLAPSEVALATKFDNLKDGLAARVADTPSKVTAAGAAAPAESPRQPN